MGNEKKIKRYFIFGCISYVVNNDGLCVHKRNGQIFLPKGKVNEWIAIKKFNKNKKERESAKVN